MAPSKLKNMVTQFWPPQPTLTEANLAPGSQAGRIFVVTGGNAGIGFELCRILFSTGATIYMASRSKEKAEAAIKSISEGHPQDKPGKGEIKFLNLDLNDPRSFQQAARDFLRQESKLDVLWNNAGTGGNAVKYGDRTAQGFEPLMGMHCIATLLFTELLRPRLQAAAAATGATPGATRVVWLSSFLLDSSAPLNGLDFSTLDKGYENGAKNYARSKAGTWMLCREFAARYGKGSILSLVVNPGNVRAGTYAGTPRFLMVVLNSLVLNETVFGAYTELYGGLSPGITVKDNGGYVYPWGRIQPNNALSRQDILKAMEPEEEGGLGYGNKLWRWCEEQWKPHIEGNS